MMRRWWLPPLVACRRGASAPEFAIASSVVLVLIVATIDVGTLFAARHALSRGLDKAARFAAIHATTATVATITSTFRAALVPALGSAAANQAVVTVAYPSGNVVGGTVVIAASYPWRPASAAGVMHALTLSAQQSLTIQH